jgi:putative ATP-binding cassette transporter
MAQQISIDRHLWQHFRVIAAPYWFKEDKWRARGLLLLVVILLLGLTGFALLFNQLTGEITSALAARDTDRFWITIEKYIVILAAAVPIYAFYYYVRDTLAIGWRRWLTRSLLDRYFSNRSYYELNSSDEIDNPDQRIAEDINSFTQKSLYFLLVLVGALLQLIAFSSVLWSISTKMVGFLVVYALVGTGFALLVFGRKLIDINFRQLKKEANFRFSLVRIRENAEAIAFYNGEAEESRKIWQRFNEVFGNYSNLIKAQLKLNFFQYGYTFAILVLPSVIIAERVLSGELEVGLAIQAAGAFAAILSALTIIVDNFESLSRFAAGIDRLYNFSRLIEQKNETNVKVGDYISRAHDSRISLKNLTLQTPNHERTLVRHLSLEINNGEGLMIVGDSGCGKSSLLRAIAGLWRSGSGHIVSPDKTEIMFLPQQPYMMLGNLRSQLLYPNQNRDIGDEELLSLLEAVNLPYLAERLGGLDAELDWGKVLSMGEQQRVAFARLLLTRPQFAMLDEATSALDVSNEGKLYEQLRAGATTFISIGHRSSIEEYHSQVLVLDGAGGWHLYSAEEYQHKSLNITARQSPHRNTS